MLDDQVLRAFPAHIHPLTLVADPDEVLGDPSLRAALADRGFRLLDADDPITLRYAVQQARPWTSDAPLAIVTTGELNTLPYDLWQPGHHVTLGLDELFRGLSYPVVRALSPRQRRRLGESWAAAPPAGYLSQEQTAAYVLDILGAGSSGLRSPAALIGWLDEYHASEDPLPPMLVERLLAELRRVPVFAAWPLEELVHDGDAYRNWLRNGWSAAVQMRETTGVYRAAPPIPFASDSGLQDMVPRLLRSGTLPALDPSSVGLPAWARPATAHRDERNLLQEFVTGLDELGSWLARTEVGWSEWQAIARLWARLCVLRYDDHLRHPIEQLWRFKQAQAPLDERFLSWLRTDYSTLATRRLPAPHQLHHVPEYLDFRRRQQPGHRPALLILDGMALADWLMIRETWQARHPAWRFDESVLLAQVPSVTSVSRQALVAGLRPEQFADSLFHTGQEAARWSAFWQTRAVAPGSASYAHLPKSADAPFPDAAGSTHTQALCLVSTVIDDMIHGATQGGADMHASLRVWLNTDDVEHQRSTWIERLIEELLRQGYAVTLTSDHGHVAAEGIGQPQEGVLAHSRSRRARLYHDATAARLVHEQYPATILWHDDGLLPADAWALMPRGRGAFAPSGQTVVSHGGLTVDEMIVPFISISES